MIRKILPGFMLAVLCVLAFYSCKKGNNATIDVTRNYFPLQFGKYVTYAVDSIYYSGKYGLKTETRCELKYAVTDTYTYKKKLNYIMDVYYRPYSGSEWTPIRVILLQSTTNSLLYSQDGTQYIKLMFPIKEGFTWEGNANAQVQDTLYSYLNGWNYVYQSQHMPYFNGFVNFDNTVTVLEDDENVNYQNVDSVVSGHKIYAKEVYAYNVGMIYKEWTYYTWGAPDTTQNRNGYSVIMRAIDHN